MKRTQLLIIVGALIAAALGIFSYKVTRLGFPVVPNLDSDTWTIEAKISFRGRGDPVTLRLALPNSEGPFTVVDESFVASGFGVETDNSEAGRLAIFERRAQDGNAVLFYSRTGPHRTPFQTSADLNDGAPFRRMPRRCLWRSIRS